MAVVTHQSVDGLIRAFGEYQIASGRITRWWTSVLPHEDAMVLQLETRSGQLRQYRITTWEAMQGPEEISLWLDVVSRDIHEQNRPQRREGSRDQVSVGVTCAISSVLFGFDNLIANTPIWSHESAEKARQLFIRAAGIKVHDALNAGKKVPLVGSENGKYWLIKQHSYCVQERRTKAGPRLKRYCAVVPGVPMWDHLLGIKLMIEHDEPRFLATANKL